MPIWDILCSDVWRWTIEQQQRIRVGKETNRLVVHGGSQISLPPWHRVEEVAQTSRVMVAAEKEVGESTVPFLRTRQPSCHYPGGGLAASLEPRAPPQLHLSNIIAKRLCPQSWTAVIISPVPKTEKPPRVRATHHRTIRALEGVIPYLSDSIERSGKHIHFKISSTVARNLAENSAFRGRAM